MPELGHVQHPHAGQGNATTGSTAGLRSRERLQQNQESCILPRRFLSSVADAPCGPGRLAIGRHGDQDAPLLVRVLIAVPLACHTGKPGAVTAIPGYPDMQARPHISPSRYTFQAGDPVILAARSSRPSPPR